MRCLPCCCRLQHFGACCSRAFLGRSGLQIMWKCCCSGKRAAYDNTRRTETHTSAVGEYGACQWTTIRREWRLSLLVGFPLNPKGARRSPATTGTKGSRARGSRATADLPCARGSRAIAGRRALCTNPLPSGGAGAATAAKNLAQTCHTI